MQATSLHSQRVRFEGRGYEYNPRIRARQLTSQLAFNLSEQRLRPGEAERLWL